MAQRVSYSLLDPYVTLPLKRLYPRLSLPRTLPPEAIVLFGHAMAIVGGVGFALATNVWWGGLLAAVGVILNHLTDVFDGTHARATGQCRNGGELLDHFLDPLSFAAYIAGLSYAAGDLRLGLFGLVVLFATAVLTNLRAKMTGTFRLSALGPTEFKTVLVAVGLTAAAAMLAPIPASTVTWGVWGFMTVASAVGAAGLVQDVVRSVGEVNTHGAEADQSEWVLRRAA